MELYQSRWTIETSTKTTFRKISSVETEEFQLDIRTSEDYIFKFFGKSKKNLEAEEHDFSPPNNF